MRGQGGGYIEIINNDNSKLFVTGDTIYCLESIENSDIQECISFNNVLNIQERNDYVLSQYPKFNMEFQKTLFIIKNNKHGHKAGLILPSLLSDKRIRHDSIFLSKKHKENIISFFMNPTNPLQHIHPIVNESNQDQPIHDANNASSKIGESANGDVGPNPSHFNSLFNITLGASKVKPQEDNHHFAKDNLIDNDLVFKLDVTQKFYQILNIKGQILKQEFVKLFN